MNIPLGALLNSLDVFLLVLTRMTGLFVVAPIFGKRNIPVILKVGIAFFTSLVVFNTNIFTGELIFNNLWLFAVAVIKEMIVGVTIGYVAYLVFTAIYVAGQLIDMQVGFGMVNVIDPLSNIQVPITANFYYILSMMLFLMANGHHMLIRALYESFKIVPINTAIFNTSLMNDILRVFGGIFSIGFKISAPVIAAILITDIALGVMSRAVPQLNVFVVGMPAKILVGLFVMLLTLPLFIGIVDDLIKNMGVEMLNFMRDMRQVGK